MNTDKAHHAFVRPLARAGYAARGVIYLIIGTLTVFAAFGTGQETGTREALQKLVSQPFGTVLLWVVVVGLVGYILWRLIQSLLDTDDHGWAPKGLGVRAGLLASAGTYTALMLYALALLGIGSGKDDDTGKNQNEIMETFGEIFGFDTVALVGAAIFAIVGGAHLWKAATRGYEKHLRASDAAMAAIHPVSMVGLTARGLVFFIIAWLFGYRWWAANQNSAQPPSLTDALDWLRSWPGGQYIFAAMGAGLVCFALYSIIESIWRQINVEDADAPTEQEAD